MGTVFVIDLKVRFFRLIYILSFLLLSSSSFAQDDVLVKRSNVIEKSGKTKYYLHTVAKGHTLFSIAKCYEVEVSDIVIENPDCLDGLSLGQVLRVPYRVKQEIVYPIYYNDHLLHKAEQGETFYSISRKYGVKVQQLQDLNGTTLAIGQIVRINLDWLKNKPKVKTYNSDSIPEELTDLQKQELLDDAGKLFHTVRHGNTLFSISRLYGVGAEEIMDLNPKIKRGIKPGQVIQIPFSNHALIEDSTSQNILVDSNSTINIDSLNKIKDSYNIAILLPFSLGNDSNAIEKMYDDKGNLNLKAKVALDFYSGAKLALDSLSKIGVKLNVFTYDTDRSVNKVRKILAKPEFASINLIIGPLYSSYFKDVATFAKQHNIGIVAPMSNSPAILNSCPEASKFVSSSSSKVRVMANYIKKNYYGANVIVVSDADANTQTLADKMYKQLYFGDSVYATKYLQTADYTSNWSITSKLSQDTLNVLFFPTSNAATVSRLLNALNLRKENIMLIGTENWQQYNLQSEFMKKLNVHLLGSSKIDYTKADVQTFVRDYRNKFNSEPSNFSFTGYDVTMAHVYWLHKKGTKFYNKLDKRFYKGLQNDILYRRTLRINGFENQASCVLKFEDFEFKKVK